MNPRVRDLYKRFMMVGRDYPLGLDYVRRQVRDEFHKRAQLSSEREINSAINVGRYYIREMIALIQLKKYRTLKGRYMNDQELQMNTSTHLSLPPTDDSITDEECEAAEQHQQQQSNQSDLPPVFKADIFPPPPTTSH